MTKIQLTASFVLGFNNLRMLFFLQPLSCDVQTTFNQSVELMLEATKTWEGAFHIITCLPCLPALTYIKRKCRRKWDMVKYFHFLAYACTGDPPSGAPRTANFGVGCLNPWSASGWNTPGNTCVTMQSPLSYCDLPVHTATEARSDRMTVCQLTHYEGAPFQVGFDRRV
jgi:hypothetical protein